MTPKESHTPIRGVRIPDDLWLPAQRIAAIRGEDVSSQVRKDLERYVKRHRHLLEENGSER